LVSSPTIVDPIIATSIPNPFFRGFIPGNGFTVRNPLPVLFSNPTFLSRVLSSLSEPTFNQFSNEIVQPHNDIHWMTGGPGGSMSSQSFAAYDPIFYLHHNMIDLVWAVYQFLNPGIDPLPGTLALSENPFDNPTLNPQEITGRNDLVGNTLDYENNLCYTYGLTGNPFLRSLDWNSGDIIFGGMNLSQISERVRKVGDTEHIYGGFFLQNLGTTYRITFNICHYYKGQKKRCFPGGGLTVFSGKNDMGDVNDIMSKVEITDKLNENYVSIDRENSCNIEIDHVESVEGNEMSKDEIFQPVNVLRYKQFSADAGGYGIRDLITVNLGQMNKNPPKMSILQGTRIKLVQAEISVIPTQIYEANNKEAFYECNTKDSKLLTSDFEEPFRGYHFYFLAFHECTEATRVLFNVYYARRNDIMT